MSDSASCTRSVRCRCCACRELRLEWCGSLRDVHLQSRSLRHVSFAGCAGVRSLELACPSLTTLNLDECSDLSRCAPFKRLCPARIAWAHCYKCPLN